MPRNSDPPAPAGRPSLTELVWGTAALGIVLFAGSLNLLFPFVGDQAVALLAARNIVEGGTLYVDFWDNKLPGLIWFYVVAGKLFGFTEQGVHALELLWMTIFSLVLMVTLRRYVHLAYLAAMAPIAVVGTYYFAAEPFHLTQLETLVTLPIFLAAWLTAIGSTKPELSAWHFFGSGLLAGITVVFKLVYAPLFVALWFVASIDRFARHRSSPLLLFRRVWLPVAAGVVLVLAAVAAKFWYDGALGELLWTAFIYPPQALATAPPAGFLRLAESLMFFGTYYAVWIGFIVFAGIMWWREERDLLTSLLFVWLVLGLGLILIQRFSWWQYHFVNLFAPAGILGVRGMSDLIRLLARDSTSKYAGAMFLSIALAFPLVGSLAVPAGQKVRAYLKVFVTDHRDVADFKRMVSHDYAAIEHSVRFLNDKAALRGPVYVFGDPLYYYLSGRKPALPTTGWAWAYYLRSQWDELPAQLDAARPPYLYIDKQNRDLIDKRNDGLHALIEKQYLALLKDHEGAWYILRREFRR